MPERLPPLTALRAFEAAARHLSFAEAAGEIGVTPAALSFQIKNLEAHLGAPLFRRLNRAVELTEAGRALAPGASDGFDRLASAWRAARRVLDGAPLTVTAGPAFTAKWLAPRLFSFAADNPDIELRFSASLRLMDFERDEVDVAIRFGQSGDEGLYSRTVIDEWLCPMVVPQIAERLSRPADLLGVPLIHQDDIAFIRPPVGWTDWLDAAGVPHGDLHGPRFSQADHAIDAALAGAGAVLGRASLSEGHLREGQLVMPFDLALRARASYRLVCPEGAQERGRIRRFMDWVMGETESIRALAATRRFAG